MAFRLVEELVYRHRENVTVIMPSRRRNHGPQISRVPTVRVVENDQLDADAFSAARIGTAKALALMDQDDVGNIHAALRALEIASIRIVVRVYNASLGTHLDPLLGDCVLMSDASMASPSFVAASLGEIAPRYLTVAGRTLYISTDKGSRNRLSWPISRTPDGTGLLPDDDTDAKLFVTAAQRRPRDLVAQSKHRIRRGITKIWDEFCEIFDRKLRFASVLLILVIVAGSGLIWEYHAVKAADGHLAWTNAIYIALLAAAGGIDPDLAAPAAEKFAHTLVSFAGVLLVPVLTASVVDNLVDRKLAAESGRLRGPISDHVIVIGLGNVGTQVALQLRGLGVPVVGIEADENSRGIAAARDAGISVVYGDASNAATLQKAQVRKCRALVAVTSNDIVNLEAALHAHSMRNDLRTVLRLFEPDLAERAQRHFGMAASLSVAGVAAAEFAAAMTHRNVKATFPVGRHLLLVGEVKICEDAELDGREVDDLDTPEQLRVLAITRDGDTQWAPGPTHIMRPGDTVLVLATRRALSTAVVRASPAEQEE